MKKKIKFCLMTCIVIYVIYVIFSIFILYVGTLPFSLFHTLLMGILFSIVVGMWASFILSFGSTDDDGGPSGSING